MGKHINAIFADINYYLQISTTARATSTRYRSLTPMLTAMAKTRIPGQNFTYATTNINTKQPPFTQS